MREIKFRAWDKTMSYMDYRVRISHFKDVIEVLDSWSTWRELKKDEYTLMQYTGLKDKNGVEIFEGDLVRFTNGIDEIDNEVGEVVWEQSECNFVAQYKTTNRATQKENGTTKTIYLISNEIYRKDVEYEVIGNIYENSDLLEE